MSNFEDVIGGGERKDGPKPDASKPVNHVVFVLDCSGSMRGISEPSMNSFNEQLQTLKKESYDQDTYVTLIMFDDYVSVIYSGRPLEEVEELKEYPTRNMTALYDAIAYGISEA